jgi:predicted RNA polymerase sigma factor
VGPYQLQAAIAAVHDEAPRVEDTDWRQIVALYGVLMRISNNPMVTLNHAIATAMVEGPQAGLALVDALESTGSLQRHYRLDAVRAHLLEMSGDRDSAIIHYRKAAERTASIPERNYLITQAARLSDVALDSSFTGRKEIEP